ncbi:MAG: class A beta-lactamase-related serine hydrolase [Candidatus Sumerlaeaceae bacterium]|nr:class A beta-lactamase-related serine hydrolase [Candidatus Sumerlaeaceae bacterium]
MKAGAQLALRPDITIPELPAFRPLPPSDPVFDAQIAELVKKARLDEHTSATENPDNEEEWSSICVVDIRDTARPRVGGWEADNFVYPASTYKMYVVGEAIRQVCAGERSLDDLTTVAAKNVRSDSRLTTGQVVSLSEVLRLICQYSDNTAANVAIDLVDRQRASALMRALGCNGSDITRKFLPRALEDDGYSTVPGTVTCARHLATFLWAVETGAIGGGRGRGLIKGYLATNIANKERLRAGLPESATIYSKTGEWNIFVSEAGIVEDGPVRYIICVLTAMPINQSAPRIAAFGRMVHALLAAPPTD